MHLGVVPKVRHLRNQTWAGYIRSLLSGLGSNGRLPTASSDFWPLQKIGRSRNRDERLKWLVDLRLLKCFMGGEQGHC